jgi:hypothetical protein
VEKTLQAPYAQTHIDILPKKKSDRRMSRRFVERIVGINIIRDYHMT